MAIEICKKQNMAWYGRISTSIVMFFLLSILVIGVIALFQIITGSTCCLGLQIKIMNLSGDKDSHYFHTTKNDY